MSLQDRLKNRTKLSTTGGGGLRDKFKKRDTSTLEKTYETRDKQTKSGSMGKTIFNHEILAKFGIEEWQPHQVVGDHFFVLYVTSQLFSSGCSVYCKSFAIPARALRTSSSDGKFFTISNERPSGRERCSKMFPF